MARVVEYDACVLHPAPLRDLLIRIARAGLVRARWTDAILDECFRSILRRRPELASPLERTRELMNAAVADCLVTGYEDLVDTLELPDPDDRHVLAAAIRGGAETIVTANLADFPAEVLARYQIEAKPLANDLHVALTIRLHAGIAQAELLGDEQLGSSGLLLELPLRHDADQGPSRRGAQTESLVERFASIPPHTSTSRARVSRRGAARWCARCLAAPSPARTARPGPRAGAAEARDRALCEVDTLRDVGRVAGKKRRPSRRRHRS